MVEVEGVLEGESALLVHVVHSGVFNHVDVLWRPPRGDVADDCLEEHGPLSGEADEERGGAVEAVFLVHFRTRNIVLGYWWGIGGGIRQQGEWVENGWREP